MLQIGRLGSGVIKSCWARRSETFKAADLHGAQWTALRRQASPSRPIAVRNCPLDVGAEAMGCPWRAMSLDVPPGPSICGTIVALPAHSFIKCPAQPGQLPLTPGRKVLDDPAAARVPQDPPLCSEGIHADNPVSDIADQHAVNRAATRAAETALPPRRSFDLPP